MRDSLLNGLMALEPGLGALGERHDWGLVHRLDRDTSGCLLVALDAPSHAALREQFEERRVDKEYLAVVSPPPTRPHGEISVPLREERRDEMKVSIPARRGTGKAALTGWQVRDIVGRRALLTIRIATGRLHQIRAHMALMGSPVVGDPIYRPDLPPRTSRPPAGAKPTPLMLHAWRLWFSHPRTGQRVHVESPPPERLEMALRA